ncbi:MAG: orotidine 5'-phosphate decarboxylase [Anaerolineae bacterium]|nr:orotidine 5'-phosphate decarboxylase [Anaerolineae bacterium]
MPAQLQLALDGDLSNALHILKAAAPHIDIVEAGTPLIYREGVRALAALRQHFAGQLLADLKIMDAGAEESGIGFAAGADWVTVLAVTQNRTISGAVQAARDSSGRVMADMMQVSDPVSRAHELLALGCDMLCVHTAFDQQSTGGSPLETLRRLREALPNAPLAVAGGISSDNLSALLAYRPQIVVVGGAITRHASPATAAQTLQNIIRNFE